MKKFFSSHLVAALVLFLPLFAFAQRPDISKIKVNGYDVYMINMHKGNGIAFTANVQTGSWHDEPTRHAGRAHLWEHVIHGGTTKYPGHSTIWKMNGELGAEYNAYTSDSRTFYHYYVHPESLPKAASILGAMVSTPEWNPETFVKEKSTVKNEAKEYQMQDARAFESSTFLYLTPPNHPLAMYDVGTQEQLDAMTLRDLKELFYSNYKPGSLQVIVAGNFDALPDGTKPVTEAQIYELVRQNFIAPNAALDAEMTGVTLPEPNRKKVFPSLVDANNPRQPRELEMGTSTENHLLQLLFDADASIDPYALETLMDYLNLRNKGTLHELLKKTGWVTGLSVAQTDVNNLNTVRAYFQLTAEGAKNRKEIPKLFFGLLHEIKTNGIANDILDYLKTRNIYSYEKHIESPADAAEYLSKALDSDQSGKNAFNFKKKYGSVTQEQIKSLVDQAFPIDRMLTTYMGPEIVYPSLDGIFSRPYAIKDNFAYRATLKRTLTTGLNSIRESVRPQLDPVSLEFSETPKGQGKLSPTTFKRAKGSQKIVLEQNHLSNQGGLSLALQMPLLSIEEQTALSFYISAFLQRNAGKLDFIQSYGLTLSIGGTGKVVIETGGNSNAAKSALKWAYTNLKDFSINETEAKRLMAQMTSSRANAQSKFTAQIATGTASTLINKTTPDSEDVYKLAQEISKDTARINHLAHQAFSSLDLSLTAYGDYLPQELQTLMEDVATKYPNPCTIEQRAAFKDTAFKFEEDVHFWKGLDATKDERAFGRAKIFQGPMLNTRESAAFAIMQDLLYSKVFSINRIRNELGYVHGASVLTAGEEQRIIFYGQYEGVEKAQVLEAGWDEVLEMVVNKTLSEDSFESAKVGLLRQLTLMPDSLSEELAALKNASASPNFDRKQQLVERIRSLTADEIYAVGQKYLINRPSLNIYASKKIEDISCNGILHTHPSQIR